MKKSPEFIDPEIAAQKFEQKTGIGYAFYNEENAADLGFPKDHAARFLLDEAQFIKERTEVRTVIHEYVHPLMGAIRNSNPELWIKLKKEIDETKDGNNVKDFILELPVYTNHKRNFQLSGELNDDAYEEMIVTLAEAYSEKRLEADTNFSILKNYLKEKGDRLHDLLRNDVFVQELKDLSISDLADIVTLGKGKINVRELL